MQLDTQTGCLPEDQALDLIRRYALERLGPNTPSDPLDLIRALRRTRVTRRRFDAWARERDLPSGRALTRHLQRPWSALCEAAGASSGPDSNRERAVTHEQGLTAIREVVAELTVGERITQERYRELHPHMPTLSDILRLFGSFNGAVIAAGASPSRPRAFTVEQCVAALRRAAAANPTVTLTTRSYNAARLPDEPEWRAIAHACGSWPAALELAGVSRRGPARP